MQQDEFKLEEECVKDFNHILDEFTSCFVEQIE